MSEEEKRGMREGGKRRGENEQEKREMRDEGKKKEKRK